MTTDLRELLKEAVGILKGERLRGNFVERAGTALSEPAPEPDGYLVSYYEETELGGRRRVTRCSLEPNEPPIMSDEKDVAARRLISAIPLYAAAPPQASPSDVRYHELIMAVASKYPGESRHKTALRY